MAHQFAAMIRQHSLTGTLPDCLQQLDANGVAAQMPSLAGRFAQGYFLPDEGQVDNRQALSALALTLQNEGVHCHWHSRVEEHALPDTPLLIDCRGFGAKTLWPGLRGVRGEVLRLYAPEVELPHMVRLLHPRYSLYLVPREHGRVVMGATSIESEDLSPVSVRSALEMLSAAYSVHPGFAEARIEEMSTQCRPALPDNHPAIQWQNHQGQIRIAANGLFRHGFLLAPVVADEVVRLVGALGEGNDLDEVAAQSARTSAWPCLYQTNTEEVTL